MKDYILTINPGSTSTKIGIFKGKSKILEKKIEHKVDDLYVFEKIIDQYKYRLKIIEEVLQDEKIDLNNIKAIVGRGGLLRPIPAGVYKISEDMTYDLKNAIRGEHASNLGAILSKELADKIGVDSFIVDPVAVDEFEDIARISGIPDITRKSLLHALNIRAISHKAAEDMNKKFEDLNLITAHLGGGISVASLKKGKIIDVNNANEMGPFSPERTGELPAGDLVNLCFSGKYTDLQMKRKLRGRGGLTSYLGTSDAIKIEKNIKGGDEFSKLIYNAMAYQVAKEIGRMSTVLKGDIDCIIITGGLAHSELLIKYIKNMVKFIAPIKIYPGEDELEALNAGVLRVLCGKEKIKIYEDEVYTNDQRF